MIIRSALVVLVTCLVCSSVTADELTADYYHFWAGSNSPARLDYELPLIRQLLDESIDKYGPYVLRVHVFDFSQHEAFERLGSGKFDFVIAPDWKYQKLEGGKVYKIAHKIWNGYLGYRQLIVRKDRLEEFKAIRSLDDLRKLRVGQGENWKDNQFYIRNNVPLVVSQSFSALFSMLEYNRFDCVPLGINEIDRTLAEQNRQSERFAVVPQLIIRYPLDVFMLVSEKSPTLAHRLNAGFDVLLKTGKQQALLRQYMAGKLDKLSDPDTVFIDLD